MGTWTPHIKPACEDVSEMKENDRQTSVTVHKEEMPCKVSS